MSLANQSERSALGERAREKYDQMSNDLADCQEELDKLKAELAPTIELLTRLKEFQGRYAEPHSREITKELARLESMLGKEKAEP